MNISEKERRELEILFPANWKNSGIRYLGVKFSTNLQGFLKKNVEDVWYKTKKQPEIWASFPLTLCGRTDIIKINVLPCFFIFSILNLFISKKLITKIQSTINKFI